MKAALPTEGMTDKQYKEQLNLKIKTITKNLKNTHKGRVKR